MTTNGTLTIAQVSASDVGGGAERVARDLHRWMYARGIDSWLLVGFKHLTDPNIVKIPNDLMRSAWARFFGAMAVPVPIPPSSLSGAQVAQRQVLKAIGEPVRALRLAEGFDDVYFPASTRLFDLLPERPQVLHFHNLHGGYFDIRALPGLVRQVPTIVTLHDAWLTTGHCAYPIDCERWLEGCGECPHLEYPPAALADRTRENLAQKRDVFRACEGLIDYVAPSHWVALQLERSIAAPSIRSIRVIPNGVNTSVFKPADDRDVVRAELGIGPKARVVAYLAASPSNPYKDVRTATVALGLLAASYHAHAYGWLERGATGSPRVGAGSLGASAGADAMGDERELVLLAIGDPAPPAYHGARSIGVPYSTNPANTARALQASDLFLHAARAEVCPLMLIEAQACGVPVVATNVGGVADVVLGGATGMLSDAGDAVGLAAMLDTLLHDDDERAVMARAAAERASELFSVERMLDNYLEVYAELAAESGTVREPYKLLPSS